MRRGLFLVIEGTDGTGKSTQYDLLRNRLKSAGHDILEIHFPKYENESSFFVRNYLKGNYGTANEVGPYTASLFYALDRYHAAKEINQALDEGRIVLCDRFVGSNMAHQGTKFDNPVERRGYFIWLDNLEFSVLGIPRPDYNFVLTAPTETIMERLQKRDNSSTHVKGKDIHEADESHIKKSSEVYKDLCNLFPKDFHRVDGVRGGRALDPQTINDLIWKTIETALPKSNQTKNSEEKMPGKAPKPQNPYVRKTDSGWEITEAGHALLEEAVTDPDGNVYAFTGQRFSTIAVAAAMARLSRRDSDMRVTLLDEFAVHEGKDEGLLKRVITAYGDDSVQQLVGQHLVVEGASQLLTKQLEWGRLAAYLEQSTRYIYYDHKDSEGKYQYFVPKNLDDLTRTKYTTVMDNIFDIYSTMVRTLTDYLTANSSTPQEERDVAWRGAIRAQACDAIRAVLPVATKSTVGIFASGQALEALIMRLRASDSQEARDTGDKILAESRKVIPTFLERADKPDRGGATSAYQAITRNAVAELSSKYLPETYTDAQEPVTLRSIWPRNELDLVPHMLYESSQLSLEEITNEVAKWPVKRKIEVFQTYMGERMNRRHRPGRALEMAHYSWDLVCDYGIFRDLQRHRMVDDLEWQTLTPRYGYEVPKLVEEAGLADGFEKCFDLSAQLYSTLQAEGYQYEAQYATLLGHRMRWKITYNAREAFHFHELRTSPQGHPGYRKLVQQMHEKLAEAHPMMAEAMLFVNQGEDPELTRLAAEKATQFKLAQLDKN